MQAANCPNKVADTSIDRRFCIAPMMDWTDRHCRYLLRLIFPRALLYTEMVTTGAIIFGDRQRFLAFDSFEHSLALQLGGNDPKAMAECARIAEGYGYDEINLNIGCPSDRVQSGAFGACLMAEPETVAACVAAIKSTVGIPVTVKTRTGIDDLDEQECLYRLIEMVAAAGCETFIIHARKAWLKGLSPKQNREVPPLNYPLVRQLKQDFPALEIVLNGGLKTEQSIVTQLQYVDGVMVGREAYQNPFGLLGAYQKVFAESNVPVGCTQIISAYLPYIEQQLAQGVPLKQMTRHMLGLFKGMPGARRWRRSLAECSAEAGPEVIEDVLRCLNN